MVMQDFCKWAGLVVVVAAWPAVASAQASVTPNPGIAGQVLTLSASVPGPGCINDVASTTVTSVPGGIRVDYIVAPVPGAICGTPPPFVQFTLPIGPFAPGSYTVDLEGSTNSVANPPITAPFTVIAAPSAAVSAPTLSIGGSLVLGLLIAGIATWNALVPISGKPKA